MDQTNNGSGLIRALKPFFIVMRWSGIELDCSVVRSRQKRSIWVLFEAGFVLLSLVVNGISILHWQDQFTMKKNQSAHNIVRRLTLLIIRINEAVFSFGPHCAYIFTVQTNWNKLFDTLKQIELDFQSNDLFRKCRKMTKIGLIFLTVVTYSFLYFISDQ